LDPFKPLGDASAGGFAAAELAMTPIQALTTLFELPLPDDSPSEEVPAASGASAAHDRSVADRIELRQGLKIGDLRLMIRYEDGSELADLPRVYRLPNAPAWFHGMTNLHGALIPVFGLAEYLGMDGHTGLEGSDGSARMMLVMGSGADAAAVLIDGLPQRLRFREEHRVEDAPVPPQLEGRVTGTYWIDEQTWMDFKPADLFNQLEAELSPRQ
jgi:purine-binding chemotaxis protein CheW